MASRSNSRIEKYTHPRVATLPTRIPPLSPQGLVPFRDEKTGLDAFRSTRVIGQIQIIGKNNSIGRLSRPIS